jgi:hypothetical protein
MSATIAYVMKKILIIFAAAFLVVLLNGCVTAGSLAKLVDSLAKDPATARIQVHSMSFSVIVDRTNPGTNTLPHSVKDGTITVGK